VRRHKPLPQGRLLDVYRGRPRGKDEEELPRHPDENLEQWGYQEDIRVAAYLDNTYLINHFK